MEQKNISGISYERQNVLENNLDNFDDVDYVGKKQIESSLNQDNKQEPVLEVKKEPNFDKNILSDKYQSIALPSEFLFYDFDTIKVRKFEIRDLAKMAKVEKSGSYSLFKEVIQGCVDVDINKLTVGDFKYLCYWLRLNSYPKTPMQIEWTSKYGNRNIAQVVKDDLIILAPDMSKEQLKEWTNKGFEVPTLKFSDIFEKDMDEDKDFIYSNAQYFKGETWEEKIQTMENYLNENGLDSLKEIEVFDKLIEHGVKEEVTVRDSKFDPFEYKRNLEDKLQKINLAINNLKNPDIEDSVILENLKERLEKELKNLTTKLESKEVVLAEPETIFLEMDATEFLSPILPAIH